MNTQLADRPETTNGGTVNDGLEIAARLLDRAASDCEERAEALKHSLYANATDARMPREQVELAQAQHQSLLTQAATLKRHARLVRGAKT